MTNYFVKSTPIVLSGFNTYDSHGDTRVEETMDWWKETVRKWFPTFDRDATNVTLSFVGDNPRSHGTTQIYVLSFVLNGEPQIVQISRHRNA